MSMRLVLWAWLPLLLFIGCDTSLDRARTVLRIGYAVEAPYAFVTADGTVTGESPEIARVVAQRLGLGRIEWRQADFGRLADELRAGKTDVVAAGMFITPDRQKIASFSRPTFRVREALLVRAGNPLGLKSFAPADARTTPKFAVLEGAYEVPFLTSAGWPSAALYLVPDALTGLRALESGAADALVLSGPTLRTMAAQSAPGTVELVAPPGSDRNPSNSGGFLFRQEDRALREAWDQVLAEFIGSPEHEALVRPYGFTAEELP